MKNICPGKILFVIQSSSLALPVPGWWTGRIALSRCMVQLLCRYRKTGLLRRQEVEPPKASEVFRSFSPEEKHQKKKRVTGMLSPDSSLVAELLIPGENHWLVLRIEIPVTFLASPEKSE